MVAALYEETKVNPLAGCLPALVQIPVFLALYRSFLNLASTSQLNEPFLWLPNLQVVLLYLTFPNDEIYQA